MTGDVLIRDIRRVRVAVVAYLPDGQAAAVGDGNLRGVVMRIIKSFWCHEYVP
jgi:hypothetical protein